MAHNLLKQAAKDHLFNPKYQQKKNPDEKNSILIGIFGYKGAFGTAPSISLFDHYQLFNRISSCCQEQLLQSRKYLE